MINPATIAPHDKRSRRFITGVELSQMMPTELTLDGRAALVELPGVAHRTTRRYSVWEAE